MLYEGLGVDLLAAAVGLILEGAVLPNALQGLALGQRVDALQAGPIPAAEHEILLHAVAQDVLEAIDEGRFVAADLDGAVPPTPELLPPVHDTPRLSSHVALDVSNEASELVDVADAKEPVDMIREPTESIKLYRVAFFGAGHDADGEAAEMLTGGQQESAVHGTRGDLEEGSTRVDMSVRASHTYIDEK